MTVNSDLVQHNLAQAYRRANRLRLNALARMEELPKETICPKEKKIRKKVYNRKARYHKDILQNADFKKVAHKDS